MFRVLEPYTVTVLVTDKCTAECRHCCMNSSPERDARLSYEQIESALTQCFANYRMKVVVFAGGEPTLIGKDLMRAISLCKKNAVVSRIVTNAYWAHSPEAARAKVEELVEAGLDELNISMDDYHEPYVPFERVKFAYEAGVQSSLKSIVVANACGPQSVMSPEFLEEQFQMQGAQAQRRWDVDGRSCSYERNEEGRLFILSNGNVQKLGRGVELVSDEEKDDGSYEPFLEQVGGCPHAVSAAAITPKNHLVSCCGYELHGNPILDFGDLGTHSVAELLGKADDDLIVNMISMIGPPRLMEILKQICPDEVSFPRKRYSTYCEVCQDLVGIDKNRQALYKYQGLFADLILSAREQIGKQYEPVTGHGLPLGIHPTIGKLWIVRPDTNTIVQFPKPRDEAL